MFFLLLWGLPKLSFFCFSSMLEFPFSYDEGSCPVNFNKHKCLFQYCVFCNVLNSNYKFLYNVNLCDNAYYVILQAIDCPLGFADSAGATVLLSPPSTLCRRRQSFSLIGVLLLLFPLFRLGLPKRNGGKGNVSSCLLFKL